jgi:hypothetical protein
MMSICSSSHIQRNNKDLLNLPLVLLHHMKFRLTDRRVSMNPRQASTSANPTLSETHAFARFCGSAPTSIHQESLAVLTKLNVFCLNIMRFQILLTTWVGGNSCFQSMLEIQGNFIAELGTELLQRYTGGLNICEP